MMQRCLLLFVICAAASLTGKSFGQEATPQQIDGCIKDLANGSPSRRFESPFDRLTKSEEEALRPVRNAYRKLTENFLVSLPILIEHLEDKEYSYPSEHPTSGVFENQTVGDACKSIIQRKLLVKNPSFLDDRSIAVGVSMDVNKKWHKRVAKMSLFEMQLDSLDWLLKQEKLPRVSDDNWNEGMKKVRAFRDEFVKKRNAIDISFEPPIEGK